MRLWQRNNNKHKRNPTDIEALLLIIRACKLQNRSTDFTYFTDKVLEFLETRELPHDVRDALLEANTGQKCPCAIDTRNANR